ncbi:MAG: hypothetical protein QOC81_1673 [Thermoanaerobaculia bacterium]|jgi:hypothetical protein|nr:hypothetical protein [Thermoanaerobaculia bacterium]
MRANPLLEKLDPAAEASMRDLIGGAVRTQAIYAVARLGVPDQLALGPRSAAEVAQASGAHAETLRRVMRYLVTCGVFLEHEDGRFALAPAGEYLQSGHPRSLRPSAIRAGEGLWQTAGALCDAVRTGVTPHDAVHGAAFFDRMPGREAAFAARMSGSTAGIADAVAAHESVADGATLVDAGGGNGWLLMQILERRPRLHGILLETDAMIAVARQTVSKSEAAARCQLVSGSFFDSIPAGDVVLLSWVLHDWNDDRARAVVRASRQAGIRTLIIVEVLLPERAKRIDQAEAGLIADPFTIDLQMLLLTGGKERTLEEYRALLLEEGYSLQTTTPLPSKRGASLLTAYLRPGYE